MKNNIKLIILVFISFALMQCESVVDDFGFDGSIEGVVQDASGNPVYADINSNTLVVKLLGEGDEQPIEIRVNGEGEYKNTKMFPKKHEVWVEGPVVSSDPITVDFSGGSSEVVNFTVTPLLSPVLNSASGSGSSVNVNYSVTANDANEIGKIEVYVSTAKYPTAAIGSRDNVYSTKVTEVTESSGSVAIEELTAGTHYFVRIGALANGASSMNYSNQIEVTL